MNIESFFHRVHPPTKHGVPRRRTDNFARPKFKLLSRRLTKPTKYAKLYSYISLLFFNISVPIVPGNVARGTTEVGGVRPARTPGPISHYSGAIHHVQTMRTSCRHSISDPETDRPDPSLLYGDAIPNNPALFNI